jgi:hypothetical protein
LAALENDPDTREGLMREHIESARTYLTLSMPEEYRVALRLAEGALDEITDDSLRDRIARFLRRQQQHP